MRKLLMLMLVLGMASLASAIPINPLLEISVGGDPNPVDSEIWLVPSEELVLDIWAGQLITAADGAITWTLTCDPAYGTLSGGAAVYPAHADNTVNFSGAFPPGGGVWGNLRVFDSPGGDIAYGSVLYDQIIFHCEDLGDAVVTITLYDGMTPIGETDSVTIHQGEIPEPMTMVLLGLGGLFLRRRK